MTSSRQESTTHEAITIKITSEGLTFVTSDLTFSSGSTDANYRYTTKKADGNNKTKLCTNTLFCTNIFSRMAYSELDLQREGLHFGFAIFQENNMGLKGFIVLRLPRIIPYVTITIIQYTLNI